MRIVVVSGLPCSGKSKLAEGIRAELNWPLLSKDVYKEVLFDTLGYNDREWSRRLSVAAYALMFAQAEELLRCGQACILEGNFRYADLRGNFARLQTLGAEFLQAHCRASPQALIARFRERARTNIRHAGHADSQSLAEIEAEMRTSEQAPLPLDGVVITCDTDGDWQSAIETAVLQVARSMQG